MVGHERDQRTSQKLVFLLKVYNCRVTCGTSRMSSTAAADRSPVPAILSQDDTSVRLVPCARSGGRSRRMAASVTRNAAPARAFRFQPERPVPSLSAAPVGRLGARERRRYARVRCARCPSPLACSKNEKCRDFPTQIHALPRRTLDVRKRVDFVLALLLANDKE